MPKTELEIQIQKNLARKSVRIELPKQVPDQIIEVEFQEESKFFEGKDQIECVSAMESPKSPNNNLSILMEDDGLDCFFVANQDKF